MWHSKLCNNNQLKAKFLRYIIWGAIGVFIIVVTILSLVKGFGDGQQGHAFLGIACFLFTLTTFFLQFKITTGDLSDAARIPVYLQLAFVVFFGVSILITVYSNWHPEELNWYNIILFYTLFYIYIYSQNRI